MGSKFKNTLIIVVIIVLIALSGGIYNFIVQRGKVKEKEKKIKDLKMFQMDTAELEKQLYELKIKVAELDSILALRKYNIPYNLPQSNFFDFVNRVSFSFSPNSYVNILFNQMETSKNYNIYHYTLDGVAEYNDLYRLIYSIEESKELKKISALNLTNNVKVDSTGMPHYLVAFKFNVAVYFSNNDQLSVKNIKENQLEPNPQYDFFYPLIRNEIPPNKEHLLDVQTAKLLALIPDGAFLSDASGNTFLLWEGDAVYLGYLTQIDYQNNQVKFILNKGGIIENVVLQLDKEKKQSK
ncbi:hypothetical protein ABRY23_14200 [Melioribacteraceae bacterium 4301-Me]|uniref:hypothetical protein n=1 Tax=Pyranulibacter aquaticus TaxID=3163344 RepID=UPI003599DE9E